MKSGWTVVCLMGALSVSLVAGSAAASPVLNSEEMGALRGGCQLYCYNFTCGVHAPCDQTPGGYCTPGEEDEDCDQVYKASKTVKQCGTMTPNDDRCSTGPVRPCGTQAQCECYKPPFSSTWKCRIKDVTHPWNYIPGV